MLNQSLNYINYVTSFSKWKICLSFFLAIGVLFFATPNFVIVQELWDPILIQSKAPFIQRDYPAFSHAAKLAFRFIPAVIIGFFNLSVKGIIIWQYINGIILFYLVGLVLEKITQNKFLAFNSMLITAFIFTGKVSFINFKDTFDSLILCLILITFIFTNGIFLLLSIICIGFIDERGLVSSGFILLFHLFFQNNKKIKIKTVTYIIGAWLCYFTIRIMLNKFYGLTTSTVGVDLKTLALNLNFAPLSIWQAFEGAWLIIILFLTFLFKEKKWLFIFTISQLCITMFIAFLVFDVTRSLVYSFPLLIIAIIFLKEHVNKESINKLVFKSMLICFIYPAYCAGGNQNYWNKPLPIKLLFEYFTNN